MGNIMVEIEFFTNGNYRYGFGIGRTDRNGRLVASYDDLENHRLLLSGKYLMDYNTKLEDCDPIANVIVPSEEELRSRQQKVLRFYGRQPDWAKVWPSNDRVTAESRTVKLTDETASVAIPARRI
jgi:hypothetical protein